MPRMPRVGSPAGTVGAIAAVLVLIVVLSAVHLLKIQTAAQQSPLLTEAQNNTAAMLDGMLTSLGFQHVTVTFGAAPTS